MQYLTERHINQLITDILNEDVSYGSDNFNFAVSRDEIDAEGNKVKSGSKFNKKKIIFRLPTKTEIDNSGIKSSDYQLPALTVYSYLMTQLGLSTRGAVRSKKISLSAANTREVGRYKKIIASILKSIGENEPVETFYEDVQNSLNVVNKDLGINLASIFDTLKTWKNLNDDNKLLSVIAAYVRGKYGSDSQATDKNTLNRLNRGINDYSERNDGDNARKTKVSKDVEMEYTPSNNEVQKVKQIFAKLQPIIRRGQDLSPNPKAYIKRITNADSFKSILREPVLDGIRAKALNFSGTCGQLLKTIETYLTSKEKGATSAHAKTVVDSEVKASIAKIAAEMKQNGMKDGFTIQNFMKYLLENNQAAVAFLTSTLGVSEDELPNKFTSFEEFNSAIYSPENIKSLYEGKIGVNVRARTKGEARKGRELQVNARNARKSVEKLEKKAELEREKTGKVSAATTEKITKAKRKAKEIVDDAMEKISSEGGEGDLHDVEKLGNRFLDREEEISYVTWAFPVRSTKTETLKFIAKKLHELLSQFNKHINIDCFDSEDNPKESVFVIDYPKSSKIYKAFADKQEMPEQIISWLSQEIKKGLNKNIRFNTDDMFFNIPQEESYDRLEGKDTDAADAWENI